MTHNHFRLELQELLADDFNGALATITLYTADGNLLWRGSLTTALVVYDDSETLLIEFLDKDGHGLFDYLGVPSADFVTAGKQQISPGAKVAQVNWDNDQAFVQWTEVEAALTNDGTPVVELTGCLVPGSSGGGVFLKGEHIANNWSRSAGCVEGSNDESLFYSKAALNSVELLTAGHQLPEQQ